MMMVIPSLIIQPSFSRLASRTPSLLMICTLLPMRAFLSTMVLLTVEFAPAKIHCQTNYSEAGTRTQFPRKRAPSIS